MNDFFISYNKHDRTWAEWIAWQLEEQGFTVVIQAWDFAGNWVVQMDKAMRNTQRTIAVLSPDYIKAPFTQTEWANSFRLDPTGAQDLLIPVRVTDFDPDAIFAQLVYVDFVEQAEDEAQERLLKRVRRERGKPDRQPIFPGDKAVSRRVISQKPAFPAKTDDNVQDNVEELLELGKQAYLSQEFTQALEYLDRASKSGSGEACFYLGELFRKGEGIKPNLKKANDCYDATISKGSDLGNWGLARIKDRPQDNPAIATDSSKLVAQYYQKARVAIESRAILNDPYCCYLYGLMYLEGKTFPDNVGEALDWIEKALIIGYKPLNIYSDIIPSRKSLIKTFMDANNNDANAQFDLGKLLFNSIETKKNHKQAINWWKKAAEQDNSSAIYRLGCAYEFIDIPRNYSQALIYYRKAAEKGFKKAQESLGRLYEYGLGVPKDYATAEYWYKQAGLSNSTPWISRKKNNRNIIVIVIVIVIICLFLPILLNLL